MSDKPQAPAPAGTLAALVSAVRAMRTREGTPVELTPLVYACLEDADAALARAAQPPAGTIVDETYRAAASALCSAMSNRDPDAVWGAGHREWEAWVAAAKSCVDAHLARAAQAPASADTAEEPKWLRVGRERVKAAGNMIRVGSDLHLLEMAIADLDARAAQPPASADTAEMRRLADEDEWKSCEFCKGTGVLTSSGFECPKHGPTAIRQAFRTAADALDAAREELRQANERHTQLHNNQR